MELPQNISGEKIAFAAQQLYTKIRFGCVVVKEKKSVQKLGRKKRKKKEKKRKKKRKKKGKKKEKKEINLIAAKRGLVGMKGYLETYNHMKYFLPYLSRF